MKLLDEEKLSMTAELRNSLQRQREQQQRALNTIEDMLDALDENNLTEYLQVIETSLDGNKWMHIFPSTYCNQVQITATFTVKRIADILPHLEAVENAFGDDLDWKHEDKASGRAFTAEFKREDLPFSFRVEVDALVEEGDATCFRVIENVEVSHWENKTYKWICE